MESMAQFGLPGVMLGILFFVVKYFVEAMREKDVVIQRLTARLMEITEQSLKSQNKLSQAIDANTQATKTSAEINKTSTDNLSKLVLELMQKK